MSDFGNRDYIEQGFASIGKDVKHVAEALDLHRKETSAYQTSMNARMDTLATKAELREAIELGSRRISNLKGLIWSACVACGTAIGVLVKFIWDLVPHKVTNP